MDPATPLAETVAGSNPPVPQAPTFPTPREIVAALDRTVFGQDEPKRILALAVYKHYVGLAADQADGRTPAFGRQHVLLEGPTGSGKSHLVRELARFLGVPVAFCPATRLVETGYVGEPVESVVRALLTASDNDVARAERGIIVLDELDKIRVADMHVRDVSGRGVQNGLLALLDGVRVPVQRDNQKQMVDTSGILFIGTGAFVGLDDIARKRIGATDRLGFAIEATDATAAETAIPHTTADFVAFGLIPELMGRFRHLARLQPLAVDDLARLAETVEDSALRKAERSFAAHGVQLQISRGALRELARRAVALDTGARALDRVLADALRDVEWRVLTGSLHDCCVRLDLAAVLGGEPKVTRQLAAPAVDPVALRQRAAMVAVAKASSAPRISDVRGWTDARIAQRIAELRPVIRSDEALPEARLWWAMFERENVQRLALVLRVVEELAVRGMSLDEFHQAVQASGTTNIQANLHFADYLRAKQTG